MGLCFLMMRGFWSDLVQVCEFIIMNLRFMILVLMHLLTGMALLLCCRDRCELQITRCDPVGSWHGSRIWCDELFPSIWK